ncbi:uncharacterized protein LOC123543471 isoform X2 [Mercenaria mercenaria]|uniref:uncharacterized protein LOC123543471 isoform X2 n=1 Tax=Mercenaria mercenaria TaxID=6596 RepID=UPI00234F38C0|nr:uncharacterized protein LOC123543471 isoform X2 [Mercenaria mercenaria]
MAVLADETGMNSEENNHKNESSHESNLYFDRQLQNKLLQVDEESDNEGYESKLSKSWSNMKLVGKSKSDTRIEDINGWFPSARFVGRRNEITKNDPKPVNNFIHPWKDYRMKKDDSFVFKHYTEFRKYIEQYRNQHGCHINRFPSGNQFGEMRRTAFQNSAPPQQTSVTVQQLHQSGFANSAPPSFCNGNHYSNISYTNRKEQLGTLVAPSSNCSCNAKTNSTDSSSQSQKYKVIPGQFTRTHTSYDLRHTDSDNSSECGDLRYRTPSRRTNSASSTRSRTVTGKTPTKITVPANPNTRAYPVQALTIALKAGYQRQQNGKADVCPSPKPLDNLNCVAPEKQPTVVDRKNVDRNLELALRVHSLNDLLTTNEAPLRGYALPKSMPPNPNPNNKCLRSRPELEGLTWAEKLEVLRSVNKPRDKPKNKQQKLKFVKADPKDPVYVWSFEHDQLYEQRRIKHLVEQARIKGGKQFDWVYEAQINSREIDWDTGKDKEQEAAVSGDSSDDEGAAGDKNLGKYGICVPPKGVKQRLFNMHGVNRSNTYIAP